MRWKTKKAGLPINGQKRTREVFAWKRVEIGNYTVWLEFYGVEERFFQPVGGGPGWWSHISNYTLDYYL